MARAVADTHTVICYLYNDARLSATARTWIEDAAAAGIESTSQIHALGGCSRFRIEGKERKYNHA